MAWRKKGQRSRLVLDDGLLAGVAAEFDARAATAERELAALDGCLQRLPEHQRTLVDFRYSNGETVRAIAARMGPAGECHGRAALPNSSRNSGVHHRRTDKGGMGMTPEQPDFEPPALAAVAGITPKPAKPFDGVNVWAALTKGEAMTRPGFEVGTRDLAWLSYPWKLIQQPRRAREL